MKNKHAILLVDDELANLQKLKRTFLEEFQVHEATSGEAALELLREREVVAIITDQRMPGMSGVEFLRESLQVRPEVIRIILTGYTEVEDLMDAINQGQVDRYITKPWDPFSLQHTLGQELERWELRKENRQLTKQLQEMNRQLEKENVLLKQEVELLRDTGTGLVYGSRAMSELLELLDRVVPTRSTVLIQGETGTGKELLARYIHEHSPRGEQAFVPVNCGAIPADLVESSFFGHAKGAFTGATEAKKGYFQLADRGTLFLDEVGEAPLGLQVKLLRVLQEGEIFPVGAQKCTQVDVRVVASTNRNLGERVDEGFFRQDLFFRLNVFSVLVPPLRARKDDIDVLCQFFLERSGQRMNKQIPGFEADARNILKEYDWPGNVRELENEMERLVILADPDRPIPPTLLSERIRFPSNGTRKGQLRDKLSELERRLILEALRTYANNKSRAAESLGISRQTIIAKLKQYGL